MSEENKAILKRANAAVVRGDIEGFLSHCTEDVEWTFIGERTLKGKEAVRRYMQETYLEPPKFVVDRLIAEGDFVVALGDIRLKDENVKTWISPTVTCGASAKASSPNSGHSSL